MNTTPRPWQTLDAENGLLITASDADATPIAEMTCRGEGCPEEADAALIVRCVNSHEGLLAALDFVQKYHQMQAGKNGGHPLPRQLAATVDAALKQARGGK